MNHQIIASFNNIERAINKLSLYSDRTDLSHIINELIIILDIHKNNPTRESTNALINIIRMVHDRQFTDLEIEVCLEFFIHDQKELYKTHSFKMDLTRKIFIYRHIGYRMCKLYSLDTIIEQFGLSLISIESDLMYHLDKKNDPKQYQKIKDLIKSANVIKKLTDPSFN